MIITIIYKLSKWQEKINHLMDIKMKKKMETLIQALRIYSQDIRIEFGIEKCAMLIMKSNKRHVMDRMELPNQEKIRMLGEMETYKYLWILEAHTIKQVEMKEKN